MLAVLVLRRGGEVLRLLLILWRFGEWRRCRWGDGECDLRCRCLLRCIVRSVVVTKHRHPQVSADRLLIHLPSITDKGGISVQVRVSAQYGVQMHGWIRRDEWSGGCESRTG